jgi:hypothetical protein
MVPRLVVLAPLVVRRMVVLLTPRQTQRLRLRLPMTAGRLRKPLVNSDNEGATSGPAMQAKPTPQRKGRKAAGKPTRGARMGIS